MPVVSVVVPSYNHARFVERSVGSALSQTMGDLEVIVVDDGSHDDSVARLNSLVDSRLRVIAFSENRGAAEATNRGILEATGDFVAILNSDDAWKPHKLERQLAEFGKQPSLGAVFSWAEFIDEEGLCIPDGRLPFQKVFEQQNRSRGKWLRRFLFEGNCLCHPSILIRREVYDRLGLYDERFRQLPDFDMWIRLCRFYDIQVVAEKLVEFRMLAGEANASSSSLANNRRVLNELMLLSMTFFDQLDISTFTDGFGSDCIAAEISDQIQASIEQALLLAGLQSETGKAYRPAGIRKLFELIGDPEASQVLKNRYQFGANELHQLTSRIDTFGSYPAPPRATFP